MAFLIQPILIIKWNEKMTYFPIRVKYSDTGETVIVNHPNDLRNGKGFYVLETRVNSK